jgi:Tol biopolymer transport system component
MSKSASEERYGIFVRNLESNIEQQLLADSYDNRNPDWSQDGTKIAFESDHNGNYDICIMNKSGGDIHDLTKDVIDERNPRWSPDGKKIAYCVYEKSGKSSIYVMNSDGSSSVRLTNSSSSDILPSWSNDGKNIFFSSNRKESMNIYIMDANGGQAKELTSKFYVDLGAKCQP